MADQIPHLGPRDDVPDLGDPRTGDGESTTIGVEGDLVVAPGRAGERRHLSAARGVPDLDLADQFAKVITEPHSDRLAVRAEGDAHRHEARLGDRPERLAGRRIPNRETALGPRVHEPAPHRDSVPIWTDRHTVDASIDPQGGLPPSAGRRIPEVDVRLVGLGGEGPGPDNRYTRPRGDPAPVRAISHSIDAPDDIEAEAPEVAEPLDVMPLPAAPLEWATVQQVLGQSDVVVFHLTIGPVDAVDVILSGELLGLPNRDLLLGLRLSTCRRLLRRQRLRCPRAAVSFVAELLRDLFLSLGFDHPPCSPRDAAHER